MRGFPLRYHTKPPNSLSIKSQTPGTQATTNPATTAGGFTEESVAARRILALSLTKDIPLHGKSQKRFGWRKAETVPAKSIR